jgi:hypothetical protein
VSRLVPMNVFGEEAAACWRPAECPSTKSNWILWSKDVLRGSTRRGQEREYRAMRYSSKRGQSLHNATAPGFLISPIRKQSPKISRELKPGRRSANTVRIQRLEDIKGLKGKPLIDIELGLRSKKTTKGEQPCWACRIPALKPAYIPWESNIC